MDHNKLDLLDTLVHTNICVLQELKDNLEEERVAIFKGCVDKVESIVSDRQDIISALRFSRSQLDREFLRLKLSD